VANSKAEQNFASEIQFQNRIRLCRILFQIEFRCAESYSETDFGFAEDNSE
jgi:hypothetical protein